MDMLSTALKLSVQKHATTARHKAFESRSPPSPFYQYCGNNRADYLSDIWLRSTTFILGFLALLQNTAHQVYDLESV